MNSNGGGPPADQLGTAIGCAALQSAARILVLLILVSVGGCGLLCGGLLLIDYRYQPDLSKAQVGMTFDQINGALGGPRSGQWDLEPLPNGEIWRSYTDPGGRGTIDVEYTPDGIAKQVIFHKTPLIHH